MKPYKGPLDPSKMTARAKQAYRIWGSQRSRNSVEYSSREFVAWWLHHISRKDWKRPHCGRIDHSKGYSFGNIEMQEQADNNRERNSRCGNPGRKHKPVESYRISTGKRLRTFKSKVEAARYYSCSEKTVYNHAMGRTKQLFKFGPKTAVKEVGFRWSTM